MRARAASVTRVARPTWRSTVADQLPACPDSPRRSSISVPFRRLQWPECGPAGDARRRYRRRGGAVPRPVASGAIASFRRPGSPPTPERDAHRVTASGKPPPSTSSRCTSCRSTTQPRIPRPPLPADPGASTSHPYVGAWWPPGPLSFTALFRPSGRSVQRHLGGCRPVAGVRRRPPVPRVLRRRRGLSTPAVLALV